MQNTFNLTERIESLKAGAISALGLFLFFTIIASVNTLVLAEQFDALAGFQEMHQFLASGAGATASGFLFGVTYRYIIRQDTNPHLKSGAVLAFGLARGLAQVEIGLNLNADLWLFVVLGLESILLFGFAGKILDLAIQRQWVKPFG
ncbi:MAG: hypothetical protein F6J93_39230 [Oscillatoria sp. SIO1A7]|nr:hypothetical protein [Oscillatoria sp. SIO1A7]